MDTFLQLPAASRLFAFQQVDAVSCRQWVQGVLQPALVEHLKDALGETGWQLEVDPDMPDGQCLLADKIDEGTTIHMRATQT